MEKLNIIFDFENEPIQTKTVFKITEYDLDIHLDNISLHKDGKKLTGGIRYIGYTDDDVFRLSVKSNTSDRYEINVFVKNEKNKTIMSYKMNGDIENISVPYKSSWTIIISDVDDGTNSTNEDGASEYDTDFIDDGDVCETMDESSEDELMSESSDDDSSSSSEWEKSSMDAVDDDDDDDTE